MTSLSFPGFTFVIKTTCRFWKGKMSGVYSNTQPQTTSESKTFENNLSSLLLLTTHSKIIRAAVLCKTTNNLTHITISQIYLLNQKTAQWSIRMLDWILQQKHWEKSKHCENVKLEHLSADGCFHALRIRPTCIFRILILHSESLSAVFSGAFSEAFSAVFPADLSFFFSPEVLLSFAAVVSFSGALVWSQPTKEITNLPKKKDNFYKKVVFNKRTWNQHCY